VLWRGHSPENQGVCRGDDCSPNLLRHLSVLLTAPGAPGGAPKGKGIWKKTERSTALLFTRSSQVWFFGLWCTVSGAPGNCL
ncbi:hypothetical protein NDU88_005275, partial [Pleurodeles waltl]